MVRNERSPFTRAVRPCCHLRSGCHSHTSLCTLAFRLSNLMLHFIHASDHLSIDSVHLLGVFQGLKHRKCHDVCCFAPLHFLTSLATTLLELKEKILIIINTACIEKCTFCIPSFNGPASIINPPTCRFLGASVGECTCVPVSTYH